ncbi:MAG: 4Fe-4S dicluster domain-containing protein [Spirochaetes bacterium]|nr:MAG: 4Fe-4S dicluster domain-containing protein [Spirochaetota bacterium]
MKKPAAMTMQLLRSLFTKPATTRYPHEPSKMPDGFRGRLNFDPRKCIGCKLCVRDCPAGGIEVTKTGDREFEVVIDLGKCIYCGQCAENCNKEALSFSDDFELAELENSKLVLRYNVKPERKPVQEP